MRRFQYSLVICLSFLVYDNYALNCRIRHTASKENELMRIYSACQNKLDHKSDDKIEDKPYGSKESKSSTIKKNPKNRHEAPKNVDDYDWTTKKPKTSEKDRTTENTDYDYVTEYVIESSSSGSGFDQVVPRPSGHQVEDYSEDLIRYDSYRSLGKRSSKKSRGRKTDKKSGQRSQYNPNKIIPPGHDRQPAPDSSKKTEDNACALHCFMETLKMTDDTGFPNRYLVMQAITKDIEDVELKEFLQESCEDCFDILSATKDEECEFSRNLLICLSDKGKANCDDWKKEGQDSIAAIKG